MYFDPIYFVFIGPGLLLSLWASWRTKSAFSKWSKVRTMRGMTGAQAAQLLLDRAGIRDVKVVPTSGFLSDHYNPMTKTLALSEAVYASPSIAAVGVACHEAGHAIQHANSYGPLWIRSLLVPTANIGSSLGYLGMAIGLGMHSQGLVAVGALLFSCVLAFQVITLPVEFDASARAIKVVEASGLATGDEMTGVRKVLYAAGFTYLAATLLSAAELVYWLLRSGILGGSSSDE